MGNQSISHYVDEQDLGSWNGGQDPAAWLLEFSYAVLVDEPDWNEEPWEEDTENTILDNPDVVSTPGTEVGSVTFQQNGCVLVWSR